MFSATLKSLWSRKLRLAMSTLAIVLGVAFVSGSFVFGDMLRGSFDQIMTGSVPDVDVSPKQGEAREGDKKTASDLTPAIVEKIKKVDGVKDAEGNRYGMNTVLIGKDGKALTSFGPPQMGFNWGTLPALGGKTGVHLVEGREPRTGNEAAVDPASLKKSGYALGDKAKIISNAGTYEITIVGTATVGEGSTAGATYVFLTDDMARTLFVGGQDVYTSVWVVTEPDADRGEVAKAVQSLLPKGYAARDGQLVADENKDVIGSALGFVDTFLLVFAGISLLVASFLIVNTFTILVAQRSKELALFRAMGASRRQIRNTVLVEAFVTGLIGSVLGLFGGILLALLIKWSMKATQDWDIGDAPIVLGPKAIVVSLVTGLVVTLLAALLPARRATKVSPVEAMTAAKTETEKGLGMRAVIGTAMALIGGAMAVLGTFTTIDNRVAIAGVGMALATVGVALASPLLGRPVVWLVGKLYRALFGEVGKLAELNSVRQPRRTAATASALMVGLTLVSMMSIFGASATESVTRQITDTVRGDYMVGRQGFQGFPTQAAEKITKVPEVQKAHVMKMGVFMKIPEGQQAPPPEYFNDFQGRYVAPVGGMDADSLDKIFPQQIVEGRMFTGDNEMILSEDNAKTEGLTVGSKLTLWSTDAQRPMTFTVVGIYSVGKGQAIMEKIVSTTTLTEAGMGKQDMFMAIDLKPGVDKEAARADLDTALADMPTVSVMDMGEYTDQILVNVNRTLGLLYGLLALSVIIAILGIINTLGLSIIERTRELGLLRAIALTRAQVAGMITLESVVISLLGAVVGVGLGTAFGICLQRLLVNQGIDRLAVPWGQLGGFLVAAAIVGVFAALWPAIRASRTNILEAIASE